MKDGTEAEWLRRRSPGSTLIGKVERREATVHLEAITRSVDTVWICRGDLGAQLGPVFMARWIASYDPSGACVPVIMAGQVLEHMTAHPEPTRSEVCTSSTLSVAATPGSFFRMKPQSVSIR